MCVPHWGQSPLSAGFLSFGEFLIDLIKLKVISQKKILKLFYNENIWNANASNSFRSLSSIDSQDSSLINALDAAL